MKDTLQPLINEFMPFAQERMGFQKVPRIFLRDDPENAKNPLGKTAFYDPDQMSVTLYIHGRHPKDVMRSLSHELVHHTQNCNGQFKNTSDMGEGYAQNDPHLREMEREAYEKGNLCIRDWEDTRKGTIYNQNMNVSIQKEGKTTMSTKDWKNRELPSLLTEKWGFSFNLLTESQNESKKVLNEEYHDCKKDGFSHEECCEQYPEDCEEDLYYEGASSSGRELTSDREQNDDRRSSQKRARPMEEAEEKGKYDDGDGKDEKCDHVPCKDQDKKKKMDEAKIRRVIRSLINEEIRENRVRRKVRSLVKEAMKEKK
jgi:hypothetical protein